MQFSESVQEWLDDQHVDIYSMSKEELQEFRKEVIQRRDEDVLLDLSTKLLGNGAYGASSHPAFFWYNINLASDITAESRETTGYMERKFDEFFHGEWWDRHDLHEKFGIKVDPSKREWYSSFSSTVYGDTDSLYFCYGDLFETFTPETVPATDQDKTEWILRFSKEFLNGWNNEQLKLRFNPRGGNSIHEFELETINKAGINLAKKKYVLANVFNKGKFLVDHPKVKSTGVELVKSSSPALARKILKSLAEILLLSFDEKHKNNFTLLFRNELLKYKQEWMQAPVEQISFSCNVGNYKQNVYDDTNSLEVKSTAGSGTKGAARFNYMANQRGQGNLCFYSGKAKYYYIDKHKDNSSVFSFPAGELPDWAPECARVHQFQKAVIDPINRFCEAMGIQKMDAEGSFSFSLFEMFE